MPELFTQFDVTFEVPGQGSAREQEASNESNHQESLDWNRQSSGDEPGDSGYAPESRNGSESTEEADSTEPDGLDAKSEAKDGYESSAGPAASSRQADNHANHQEATSSSGGIPRSQSGDLNAMAAAARAEYEYWSGASS